MVWLCADWKTDWTAIGAVITGVGVIAAVATIIVSLVIESARRSEFAERHARRATALAHALNMEMIQAQLVAAGAYRRTKPGDVYAPQEMRSDVDAINSTILEHAMKELADFDIYSASRITSAFATIRYLEAGVKSDPSEANIHARAQVVFVAAVKLRRALLPYRRRDFIVAKQGPWRGVHPLSEFNLRTSRSKRWGRA